MTFILILYPTIIKQVLEKAGWIVDKAEDSTKWFKQILLSEKSSLLVRKVEFLEKYTNCEESFQDLIDGWDAKLARVEQGHQKWGVFLAHKAM